MRHWASIALLPLCATLVFSCVTAAPEPPPASVRSGAESRVTGLRSSDEVGRALQKAQAAYLAGRWGDAVVEANRVLEGAASPEEFYAAVKILGLVSCARKDPRPVTFAWIRLLPADRDSLRNECAHSGLHITDEGAVVPR